MIVLDAGTVLAMIVVFSSVGGILGFALGYIVQDS